MALVTEDQVDLQTIDWFEDIGYQYLCGYDIAHDGGMPEYVDKPMQGANLAQAIARVNHVFKGKPGGKVVDHIGIAAQLKEALATYSAAKGKGRPTIDSSEALHVLLEKLQLARDLLHPVDWNGYETNALQLIPECLDHILAQENGKRRYCDAVLQMTKVFALCGTLDEAIRKYANRGIEAAQVIEELIAMAKEFKEDLERATKHKLTSEESSFYDALAQNISAQELMEEELLVEMAREVASKLRENITVDWSVRESVRARLRILIRQLLRKYKYPSDEQLGAVDFVIKQAEAFSEDINELDNGGLC